MVIELLKQRGNCTYIDILDLPSVEHGIKYYIRIRIFMLVNLLIQHPIIIIKNKLTLLIA